MKITRAESFLLKRGVNGDMGDSMQTVRFLEFIGLRVYTDEGVTGTGYTITVGAGGSVIQNALDTLFIPAIIGEDPYNVKKIWRDLYFGPAHWIGRAGATTMAQAAVDIALWDIIAKCARRPLWQVLGACRPEDVPIYNTHGGWLNFSIDQLKNEAAELLDKGYTALKMKVGKPDVLEDCRRIAAVRETIGDSIHLMVDANQIWDIMQARIAVRRFEQYNLSWVEEPMHPDDIRAHKLLKKSSASPVALGEHVYTTQAFRDYMENDAVDVVQVDVVRVGGITPWLEVAALANAYNLRVCPHCGDLMQVHQHLVKAIPNSWYLEVIPIWEDGPFADQIKLKDGKCITPDAPGASSDFKDEMFERYRIS